MSAIPRLIALSPGDLERADGRLFLERVERALAGGLPGLLLREPGLSDRASLALGEALLALRARLSFWFAVHDRAHLARALGADALHLSFRSLAPREARRAAGEALRLGLSTHAGDDPAGWQGCDYLFHGPLHATPKPHAAPAPLGLEGLVQSAARARVPVLALGGVRPRDAGGLRARGLHGVAVRSGILQADDPEGAVRSYLEALA